MRRYPGFSVSRPSVLAIGMAAVVLAGCNVLFVPRKPVPSPTETPNPAVHAFPALEARLPNEIDGKVLQKFSLTSDPELQTPKTLEVLRRLGKGTTDLQLARGSATGLDLTVSAMRIVGSDAIKAAVTLETVDESDPNGTSTYTPGTVAGKRVLVRVTGDVVAYIYPLDDVLFILTGQRPLVEEALVEIS